MKMIWSVRQAQKDLNCGREFLLWMNSLFLPGRKGLFLAIADVMILKVLKNILPRGGYRTYVKTIRHYTYEEVCDIIEKSGLRGRSGGGYLTGLKWKHALNTSSMQDILSAMQRRVIRVHLLTEQFLKVILTV